MKKIEDIIIAPDLLSTLYNEAWNQYRHEDNLGLKRTQVFTAVQAGLIAVLALITKPLIALPTMAVNSHVLHIGLIVLGSFMVIIGLLSCFLAFVWRSVTNSGRCYLNLRWFPIYAIEKVAKLDDIDIAGLEDRWRKFFKMEENKKKKFKIYDDIEELAINNFTIGPLPLFRGWASIEVATWVFQIISILFVIAGIGSFFVTRAIWLGTLVWPS